MRSIPDEVMHFGAYAVLGATLAYALRAGGAPGIGHGAMIALGALFGASDEWHQSFVPGRVPSPTDWIADVLGVAVGYALTRWAFGRVGGADAPQIDEAAS